ncbi:hypothetical protein P280DRAFT_518906 [Massarina eburnea CBS 473.64]|uniref:Uncharacterized protein n=1 Tax=Massarina eburnea CBS 473.64 TaxID=1395130 RepID=A0A6A6RVA5_9PLEO|nr:hypothetical protein P280DRAFT_518906 [Massarina eburnea CBS 473.64]
MIEFLGKPGFLKGIHFVDKGLTGIEELYIQFTRPQSLRDNLHGGYLIPRLETIIWEVLTSREYACLKKIRFVYGGGALRSTRATEIYENIRRLRSSPGRPGMFTEGLENNPLGEEWSAVKGHEKNRFYLVEKGVEGGEIRRIAILLGSTPYEAETHTDQYTMSF